MRLLLQPSQLMHVRPASSVTARPKNKTARDTGHRPKGLWARHSGVLDININPGKLEAAGQAVMSNKEGAVHLRPVLCSGPGARETRWYLQPCWGSQDPTHARI